MTQYHGCDLPEDLYYDLDYVWVRPEEDGTYTLGITDPAQTMSGRVQYARFKKPGKHIKAGKPVGRLESSKWAGGVPAPFDGELVAVNPLMEDDPGYVNIDPYGDAWLVRLKPDDAGTALANLYLGEEAEKGLKAWIDRYDVYCMRCATGEEQQEGGS
jgi:glycine cleavage system H protein